MIITYYINNSLPILWANNKNYMPIVLVFNLTWLLAANITKLYDKTLNRDSIIILQNVIKTYLLFITLISLIIIIIGIKSYYITRDYLIYSSFLFGTLLLLWKLIFFCIRKNSRSLVYDSRNVVIVGMGKKADDLRDFFLKNPDKGYNLIGFFDDRQQAIDNKNSYLGCVNDCINYVLSNNIDEIFCTLPIAEKMKIENLLNNAEKNLIRFKIIPEYLDYGIKPMTMQSFGHIPVLSLRPEPLENILSRLFKRLFDVLFSASVIFFILTWLYPILAICIKLGSKGPVIFKQLRSGRDNNSFWCYKFRSMKINSDSDSLQAVKNDYRVTRLGAFMRKTSIDELPQFFNVLMGDMSTVGPRPHMLSHTTQYAKLIDKYMIRHFLKPGITGYAQIKGFRGETRTTDAMLKRLDADVWYLENWSFLLDLKIIFLTVWNIFKGDKNAF